MSSSKNWKNPKARELDLKNANGKFFPVGHLNNFR